MIDEKRKVILDKLLEECKQMYIDKSWPVSEDEIVEHTGIRGSFEFGYLCGSLHQRNKVWHDIENEQPRKTDKILFLRDGQVVIGTDSWLGAFTMPISLGSKITPFHNGDKWCRIDDMLPIKEK